MGSTMDYGVGHLCAALPVETPHTLRFSTKE
jgi:hypothetical protein